MEPLDAEETAALVAQTATREIDASVLHRIYQTTKGNPLFVVESIRASLDKQLSEREVPPRIQAVISARLAQLSAAAYELTGLAAAIGRSFTMELLAKATDWDEDSLSGALEELWRFRIIDGQDGVAYDYTHGLLRDVAYAEVNPIRRRLLHRRIARALSEIYSPDFEPLSGWLAGHFDAAGMAEEAIRFYKAAASVAKLRFADAEAANLIRRALTLCLGYPESARRDREELELLATLGASLVKTDGYTMPEVGETYERGLILSKRCDDRTHLFPLLSGSWAFHIVRGQLEDSRRLAQDYVDGARRHGISGQEDASHFLLGTSLFHLGKLQASWDEMGLAGSSADGRSHPALALFAGPDIGVFRCAYLSHLLCLFGHREEAVAKSEECVAAARRLSHPFTLAIALDYAAIFRAWCGEAGAVQDHAGEASGILPGFGSIYYLAVADILAGCGCRHARECRIWSSRNARGAGGSEIPRSPSFACLSTMRCWRKPANGRAEWEMPWRISPPVWLSSTRTPRPGRHRNSTEFTEISFSGAAIGRSLRQAIAGLSIAAGRWGHGISSGGRSPGWALFPHRQASRKSASNGDFFLSRTLSERSIPQSDTRAADISRLGGAMNQETIHVPQEPPSWRID